MKEYKELSREEFIEEVAAFEEPAVSEEDIESHDLKESEV